MRDEHNTLVGFGSGDDLPSGRQPVRNFGGQISGLSQLLDVLLYDRGRHPPTLEVGSGHGSRSEAPDLSLGCWNSRWGKDSIERERKKGQVLASI